MFLHVSPGRILVVGALQDDRVMWEVTTGGGAAVEELDSFARADADGRRVFLQDVEAGKRCLS
jgi:hypothetical protein